MEKLTAEGVPSLAPMKLISLPKGQPKASDTYGFTNLKSAFTGDLDGSYAKTKPTLLTFLKPFQSIPGFGFTSTKRSSKLSRAGNISDHWDGNPTSYGVDIALKDMEINVGQETDKDLVKDTIGDKIFLSIMKAIGKGIPTKGGIFKANPITGFRIQVIWRTEDHYDHIHVGLRNEVAFKKFSKIKQNNQDVATTNDNEIDNIDFDAEIDNVDFDNE